MKNLLIIFFALFAFAPVHAQIEVRKSSETITLEGEKYYMHTVSRKETLFAISKAYGVSMDAIKDRNPFVETGLRNGQVLLVPIKEPDAAAKKSAKSTQSIIGNQKSDPVFTPAPMQAIALPPTPPMNTPGTNEYPKQDLPQISAQDISLGLTRNIDANRPLKVALLLPFGSENDATFVDFYRGALIALAELKDSGVSVEMNVLSTGASISGVESIISSGALDKVNLIIGPVYDKPFEIVAAYAAQNAVPIISPLTTVGSANNPYVVAVAPKDGNKWDKIAPMLADPTSNVIYIDFAAFADAAVVGELAPILPPTTRRIPYAGKPTPITDISSAFSRESLNVIVVPVSEENAVDALLARISSANAAGRYKIAVIGTSRWARFKNINFELLFKLSATYPASYYSDRANDKVKQFFRQYITDFETIPSLFSFRGYDVTKSFIGLLSKYGRRAMLELSDAEFDLLQTPYKYLQNSPYEKFENGSWALVTHNPNFTTSVQ